MLFEPCGDLRKDYGAYCETLRLTEREEVYRALHTTAEHPYVPEHEEGEGKVVGGAAANSERAVALLEPTDSAAATTAAAAPAEKPAKGQKAPAAAPGRKAGGKGKEPTAAELAAAAQAAEAAAAADAELRRRCTLTYVSIRHPTFCINQRDITPLCRAMPHCPSLMSVQLVGCGLSQEAYMLLVEAVYKCRRVVTVEVDFNSTSCPGFVPDPSMVTLARNHVGALKPPTQSQQQQDEAAAATFAANASLSEDTKMTATLGMGDSEQTNSADASGATPADPQKASSLGGTHTKRKVSSGSKRASKWVPDGDAAVSAAAADAAAVALAAADEPGAIYLKPTEFCGLHLLSTPLEEQVNEEKEKKGKVDAKKVAQLQAQLEAMREFDQTNRMKVPRGWHGLLYTGLRHLSLRGNGIADDTVADMVDAIQSNPYTPLLTLSLWGNAITDVGAAHLARLLAANQTLHVLDLGHNRLSDNGVLTLVDCFRTREMTSAEDLTKYRYATLTRPSATDEERQAAALDAAALAASLSPQQQQQFLSAQVGSQSALLAPVIYPSFQDIYRVWYATRLSGVVGGGGVGGDTSGAYTVATAGDKSTNSADASGGPTSSASGGRRGGGGGSGKGKVGKAEPLLAPTALNRLTTPFDRDCVRVLPTPDSPVRVPGNTVLEVLNLGENALVTAAGAREAARRLGLHEPHTDEDMLALVAAGLSSNTAEKAGAASPLPEGGAAAGLSSWPPLTAAVEAPEPYCAGIRLRSVAVFAKRYADGEAEWAEMLAAQRAINAALDSWVPRPPSPVQPQQVESGSRVGTASGRDVGSAGEEKRQLSASAHTPSRGRGASRSPKGATGKGPKAA